MDIQKNTKGNQPSKKNSQKFAEIQKKMHLLVINPHIIYEHQRYSGMEIIIKGFYWSNLP